ncbi:hypothetical protein F5Y17DRAFT_274428 [Xylariaceae sp. FL0594]|nr:hypothetical protein F5Y17DRAFT_274428 [Xylariaceae sp. FL0594]
MPLRHRRHVTTTTSHPTKMRHRGGGLFSRHPRTAHTSTTTTRTTRTRHTGTGAAAVHHHHKRHASLGDKVSGALLKLKGALTHRPGFKAAGTRRMHGTDGRGSRRHGGARLATRRKYRY